METEKMGFMVVSDDSSHLYVIPTAKADEWENWLSSDDAMDGVAPTWARPLGGALCRLSFDSYVIGGK